jgi:hypothetical protein
MTDDISDQAFADRAFKRLPPGAPVPGLEAALLAAYDAWNAGRPRGRWTAWKAGLHGFSETIWPGAPVWAPASAFAAALLVGAGLGAVLPTMVQQEQTGFSLERTASFSLLTSDMTQEDL